jgi:hypothetical protein
MSILVTSDEVNEPLGTRDPGGSFLVSPGRDHSALPRDKRVWSAGPTSNSSPKSSQMGHATDKHPEGQG